MEGKEWKGEKATLGLAERIAVKVIRRVRMRGEEKE